MNETLSLIKRYKTHGEFAWMLASYFLYLSMKSFKEVTYLDSDLFFYQDPELVFQEIGDKSVAIVSHNFPEHDFARLSKNGLYNVSWVTFREDTLAREILAQWASDCLKNCSIESAGDQKYLDIWPERLGEKLYILNGKRYGAGPWNAYTYDVQQIAGAPEFDHDSLVFFHFHEHWRGNTHIRTGYPLTERLIEYVYKPYEAVLTNFLEKIASQTERRS